MSSLSRTIAREAKRGENLMEKYQEGNKPKGPSGKKTEKPVNWTISHRRCSKCHARPKKKEDKHKIYLYKGFSLCKACYIQVKKEGA